MPRSKRPRKQYRPTDWSANTEALRQQSHGRSPIPEATKPAPATASAVRRSRGRYLVPAALVGAGAVGGAAYLAHRRRSNVTKLYNPFTDEIVEVEKGAINRFQTARSFGRAGVKMGTDRASRAGSRTGQAQRAGRAGLHRTADFGVRYGDRISLGAGVGLTGLDVFHRQQRKKAGVTKRSTIANPPGAPKMSIGWPPQSSKSVRALLPTGKHVGHANDLVHRKIRSRTEPRQKLLHITHGRRKVGKSELYYGGVELTPAFSHNGVYANQRNHGRNMEIAKGGRRAFAAGAAAGLAGGYGFDRITGGADSRGGYRAAMDSPAGRKHAAGIYGASATRDTKSLKTHARAFDRLHEDATRDRTKARNDRRRSDMR